MLLATKIRRPSPPSPSPDNFLRASRTAPSDAKRPNPADPLPDSPPAAPPAPGPRIPFPRGKPEGGAHDRRGKRHAPRQRDDPLAEPFHERGAARKEERNVRPDAGRHRVQLFPGRLQSGQRDQPFPRRRRVGTPTA